MELSELKAFLDGLSPDELDRFAKRSGTTSAYLAQIKGGHRRASTRLAQRLVSASTGRLRLHAVRPDVWPDESRV
jgi:DNA-binding transcriptional regulator YdaS (Cro superfamily)